MLTTQHDLDLQKVLSYPLSPIPWALATPDGLPVKTDKSILMHKLEDPSAITDVDRKTNEEQTVIIDGNALLHSLTSIPETFGQLAEKIFNLLPNTKSVHFVTDTYNHNSIKCPERLRRAVSQAKPLLMCGQSTKTPKDWRAFLSREENKRNFINFLLTSWQENKYAEYLSSRELFFVCADQCLLLTTHDGTTTDCSIVQSLCSSQEEADTRIILHCFYAATTCQELVIHSPDTDVFLLLLYFTKDISTPVFLHTGTGIHRRIINMLTLNMIHDRSEIRALLGLHSFTGCDTTSAFLRRGKSKSLKIIKTKPHFKPVFEALGLSAEVDTKTMSDLEQFVCEMYGKPSYTDVNKFCFDMVRQRFRTGAGSVLSSNDRIDLSLLSPCRSTLHMHIKRANYQALVWKESTNAYYPDLPSPEEHGWKINSNGDIDYNWCGGDIIPQELVDILSTNEPESNDSDDTVDNILSDDIDSDEASDSEDSDVKVKERDEKGLLMSKQCKSVVL